MWVQLLKAQRMEDKGIYKSYNPGDWIDVGKQTAMLWITQGIAKNPKYDLSKEYVDGTSGIVVVNSVNERLLENIRQDIKHIEYHRADKPELIYSENMIWSNGVSVKRELVPIGFKLLRNWEIALPLYSYDMLAIHLGTDEEKEYIKSIIHDLRVPIYNTDLMFIRRCDETRELIKQWYIERLVISNVNLAFHVAMYKIKPILCALPTSWVI
jgi:hypothetical protein